MCGSDLVSGPTRHLNWLMNRVGDDEQTDRRETGISFALPLFLSHFISRSLSLSLCLLPTSAVSQSPARQPTAEQAVLLRSTHTWAAAVQQQERASSAFTCRSRLQTSLRLVLVIIIINYGSSRDKPSAFQNSQFCLWDGVARTDKLGVYLKAFYFGQRSTHHASERGLQQLIDSPYILSLWLNTDI